MIIDFHTHVFPDELAPRAIAELERQGMVRAVSDGTVAGLLRSMDRAGIDRSVVLPVSTREAQVATINRWIAGVPRDRLIPFGTLFPGMKNVREEAARLAESGIPGVKLHPDYQCTDADDPVMIPIYEACREYDLLVMLHAGVDLAMAPPVRATPEMIASVLDRFPGLRLVAAHLGGNLMPDAVMRFLSGRDVFFDTAYCVGEVPDDLFHALVRGHGTEKVLFATDHPWIEQPSSVARVLNSPVFTGSERRLLFGENALRALGEL